ncbi:MAG: 1-acyl-sn-glycerol-3-phosphate acyltransferase [Pseudonocardiales bacterium]|nr:1-acyl-sn-glycerol-3-phosphate acyltransferase [Pseudonocardiales bacterium]
MLYRAAELVVSPLLRAYFKPRASGQQYVPRTGPAIIAANHLSAADEVFTPITAGRQVLYFAKAEYFNGPGLRGRVTAWTFSQLGLVPVDRDNPRAAANTIDVGVELLGQHKALGIYPEGTRSPDGRLHKFRTGVARLALRTGAPVIPVGLVGTDKVLAEGSRHWYRAPVEVNYGPALDFSGRAADERSAWSLREVTETIREAVQKLSGQDYVDTYGSSVKVSD